MGIKHFFSWFSNQFSENIHKLVKNQQLNSINVSVDNLMIDMNGIFHNSAQKIYEYGNCKPPPRLLGRQRRPVKGIKAQLRLFEDVCKTVEELFNIAQPTSRLVLCVDGPAPLSKQNQQRQRRFRSAKETSDDAPFNSNCITPGTKFMDHLTKYIDWYIRKRISEDRKWQDIQVIFSNEKAPGEGEHKIINFMRKYGTKDESYCICGLDADLIMLALGTHMPKFYILREDLYDCETEYLCVDVGAIRHDLVKELKWKEEKYNFDDINSINDFIFMCFMVGNDFLPHIPSIEIIEQGIELMIEVYKETCTYYGHLTKTVNNEVKFQKKPLEVFLGTIGQHEKSNFEAKLDNRNLFFTDELLENCSFQDVDGTWDVDIDKYNEEYLKNLFEEDIDVKKLCHEYLEGMQWVLSYYTRGVPNWKWNFRHHYAPPASVLSKHVKSFVFPVYGKTIPSTPFQQLLCVFPPKSANLIPYPLCELLTDKNSPLVKHCPEDFKIDLSGKRREWEGIVILPMVDFDLVQDCYMKELYRVDKRDLRRNVTGRSFLYSYNEKEPRYFNSYYGDINQCHAFSTLIDL